jgi:hypothetical protein
VALLALSACGPSDKHKPAQPGPAEKSAEKSAPAMASGEVQLSIRDGKVTLVSHEAPRALIVEKLARESGFELAGEADSQPVSLSLDAVSMEDALSAVLAGAGYRAQWKFDADQNRHSLAKLELGELPASTTAAHKPKIGEALRERIRAMRERQQPTEKQKAEAAARREERARTQADALEELRSSSPEMRMEAAGDIEPEGPALASLLQALSTDNDARVRAKVAEQLADADGCVASMGLVAATNDADPSVRCAAWHSLEMNCDESMLPSMQPRCANETDATVRECCTGTLEMCE